MKYWLMKSEPGCFSIDDLKSSEDSTTCWDGVRNYQARNFMRDEMSIRDKVLFYHSNCPEPGIVGLAEIVSGAYPDFTAFDPSSDHYDPKSTPENPRWFMVDVRFVEKFEKPITLRQIKSDDRLAGMLLVKGGMRLSVQPVEVKDFNLIMTL